VFSSLLRDMLVPLWDLVGSALPAISTSFFSVLVGALPFIVVAAFASAILEVYVSPDAIARLVPRNPLLGILLAPVFGLVFPMCECGIVPVARRMIQKGVPGATAIAFMLANPILNPLSIYATYLAFPFARSMVLWRVGLGYLVAVLIGLVVQRLGRGRAESEYLLHPSFAPSAAHAADCACGHDHHQHEHTHVAPARSRLLDCLNHATTEFFDVLKYFIIGSGLAAISQALLDRRTLEFVGSGRVMSVLVMIAFAYLICVCSEADAFVAASFTATFMPGALLGFLVAGPMTDIKNTMMMQSAFRRSFVLLLNGLIIGITAVLAIGLNFWMGWGR
jgi:uncharacterized membrane protein YraQ (UPF0718 family)